MHPTVDNSIAALRSYRRQPQIEALNRHRAKIRSTLFVIACAATLVAAGVVFVAQRKLNGVGESENEFSASAAINSGVRENTTLSLDRIPVAAMRRDVDMLPATTTARRSTEGGSKMRNTTASTGQKERRDLRHYDYGGSYTLPLMGERAQQQAAVRGFLWEHWRQQRRGTISVTAYSREGEPSVSSYFVEPDVNGRWRVAVEIKRTLGGRGGSRNHFSQATEYEVYSIDRIEIPNDGLTPRTIIPEGEPRSPATYMLSLKNRRGQVLNEM